MDFIDVLNTISEYLFVDVQRQTSEILLERMLHQKFYNIIYIIHKQT